MAKFLLFTLFGLFSFALAAAGSWIFVQQRAEQDAKAAEVAAATAEPTVAPNSSALESANSLPVVLRGRPMSAEEAFRYGAAFRSQQETLKKREQALKGDEVKVKLMKDDLKVQQRELEGLLSQVRELLKNGEALAAKVAQDQNQLEQDRQAAQSNLDQLKQAELANDRSEQLNVKQVSGWFQSMPAENAAEYLRELSNDGKLDSALELLSNIEERDAAKILVAMKDPALVAQLTETFRGLKRPEKQPRR
ncbi:MAG: hypothetical protein WBF93_17215 [Pirellulales bacterium]